MGTQRHFTASAYVIDNQRLLFIHHRKFGKWMPPGGHVDPNETPAEAVIREVFEETGLNVKIVSQENVWISYPHAASFERPFLCVLEEVPAFGDHPAHQHMDLIYVATPLCTTTSHQLTYNEQETSGLRWFTLEEIEALECDKDIFIEVRDIARTLLTQGVSCLTTKPSLLEPLAKM